MVTVAISDPCGIDATKSAQRWLKPGSAAWYAGAERMCTDCPVAVVSVPPVNPGGANAAGRLTDRSTSGAGEATAPLVADAAASAASAATSLPSIRVWKQLQGDDHERQHPRRERVPVRLVVARSEEHTSELQSHSFIS